MGMNALEPARAASLIRLLLSPEALYAFERLGMEPE